MQLLLVSRGHGFVHESRGESIVSPRAAWRDVSRHEIRSASRLGFGMIVFVWRGFATIALVRLPAATPSSTAGIRFV